MGERTGAVRRYREARSGWDRRAEAHHDLGDTWESRSDKEMGNVIGRQKENGRDAYFGVESEYPL